MIAEPIRGPDTQQAPAETLKGLLTKSITVAGGFRTVISRAIALDADDISRRLGWVPDRYVDEVAGDADLQFNRVSPGAQSTRYRFLKRTIRAFSGRDAGGQSSIARIGKVVTKYPNAACSSFGIEYDVFRSQRAEQDQLLPGPGKQYSSIDGARLPFGLLERTVDGWRLREFYPIQAI